MEAKILFAAFCFLTTCHPVFAVIIKSEKPDGNGIETRDESSAVTWDGASDRMKVVAAAVAYSPLYAKGLSNSCSCLADTCACCEHLDIPRLHINDTGCVEIVYLEHDIGLSLLLLIDNVALINRTVSVRNPPPICYAVPKVSLANLCVQFYQLDVKDKLLSGCVRVVAEVAHTEIYRQTIGCFRFPVFPRVAKRITAHALYIVTRSTVLAEINAHPEISVHQKQ